jgi:uncharacterized protein YciI
MIFVITLTYRCPLEAIERHLEPHRNWLAVHYRAGRFLLSGPLEPRTGGLILAQGDNRAAVEALLADDPFSIHGLAAYDIKAVNPSLRAPDFPADWAPIAKTLERTPNHSDETR